MTDDLLVWLREQLDEDERLARSVPSGPWTVDARMADYPVVVDAEHCVVVDDDHGVPLEVAEHIARWDPARVLREVEAKRRILDLADSAAQHEAQNANDPVSRLEKALAKVTVPTLERVLRLLALPYSDRPGYRQEWAP